MRFWPPAIPRRIKSSLQHLPKSQFEPLILPAMRLKTTSIGLDFEAMEASITCSSSGLVNGFPPGIANVFIEGNSEIMAPLKTKGLMSSFGGG